MKPRRQRVSALGGRRFGVPCTATRFFAAMNPKNRNALAERVVKAAEAALAARGYASSIDVLVGIGWLDAGKVEQWRRGQIDYVERVVQTNLPRISEAMKLFRSWATRRGLSASPTSYIARSPRRQTLRFSRSGDPTLEALYRTHWVSQELPSGNANAWRRKQAVPRIWWWSSH